MNSFDDIPHDAQLHALLDGELDRAAEEGMLSRISADPELQRHYHDLVEIHSTMKADAQSLSVPPEATNAVFAALGFAVATSSALSLDAPPVATAPTEATSRSFRTWLIVAMLLLSLCAIVLYIVFPGSGPTTTAQRDFEKPPPGTAAGASAGTPAAVTRRAPSSVAAAATAGVPPAAIRNRGARAGHGASAGRSGASLSKDDGIQSSTPGVPVRDPVDASPDASANAPQADASASRMRDARSPSVEEGAPVQEAQSSSATAPDLGQLLAKNNPVPTLGLRFTVRGMASTSSPTATIESQTNTDARNIAIGLDYSFAERQFLGVSLGREAFSQHFGRTEAGRYVTYEQNPLEFWVAAYYEHTLTAFMPNALFLYARVDAGSVLQLGPMLRGSLGFRLHLTPHVGALLAAEGTIAGYRNESIWLTTKKLGGTAGLSIAF
jgi:hypothetical protein